MGTIFYGTTGQTIELDDRAMAHLQAVIAAKLRRGEGFFLSWRVESASGEQHSAAWIAPNIPMLFRYAGVRPADLSRAWLEQLNMAANSNAGLLLGEEPPATGSIGSVPG